MDKLISLLELGLIIGFIFSLLVIIKHAFLFIRNLASEIPEKYTISKRDLLYLGLSIAISLGLIINGFNI